MESKQTRAVIWALRTSTHSCRTTLILSQRCQAYTSHCPRPPTSTSSSAATTQSCWARSTPRARWAAGAARLRPPSRTLRTTAPAINQRMLCGLMCGTGRARTQASILTDCSASITRSASSWDLRRASTSARSNRSSWRRKRLRNHSWMNPTVAKVVLRQHPRPKSSTRRHPPSDNMMLLRIFKWKSSLTSIRRRQVSSRKLFNSKCFGSLAHYRLTLRKLVIRAANVFKVLPAKNILQRRTKCLRYETCQTASIMISIKL